MICVSVGRGRHRMMIAEHRHLAEQGAELVELRLDFIRRAVNLRRLLEDRQCPVVATCRRKVDGGRWEGTEAERLMLLRTAIADGADYVDLEMDIADKIPRYANTQRIVSYHNFDETPDNIESIHHQIRQLDPDIIKIATMANNPIDNIKLLRLCRDSEIPTTAFCMGEMGLISRLLCGKFGAPMTYATFSSDRKLAPGQLTFEQMRDEFRYDTISSETKILGVIADPVAHSLSPVIHNAAIQDLGLDMIYLPFRVPKEHLDEFIQICPEMDVLGLSVTIPHKEACLKCINVLDDNTAGIKAANTIVFKDVNACGYNTDCSAAMESLANTIAEVHPDEDPFEGRKFLLLGAGGVARAIAFGLKRRNAKVTIAARDYRKSEDLANSLECDSIDWSARANFEPDVLVNCTPVGMHPKMDETPFDAEWFDKRVIVFDTIYNPEQTLFIKQARQAGCKTITGVDMFVRQAAEQFKLFTGKEADSRLLRYELKRATSAAKNWGPATAGGSSKAQHLYLIGYRGSGKSTVAPLIADLAKLQCYDVDVLIEERTNYSIAEIFAQYGEEKFRKQEIREIARISRMQAKPMIISLGGGALENPDNRRRIKRSGKVVWLRARPDTLWKRIKNEAEAGKVRPNLTKAGGLQEVEQVLDRRSPVYEEHSDFQIDVDEMLPHDIAREVLRWWLGETEMGS